MPVEVLLDVLPLPCVTSVTCLGLHGYRLPLSRTQAERLCAAMPALSRLNLHLRLRPHASQWPLPDDASGGYGACAGQQQARERKRERPPSHRTHGPPGQQLRRPADDEAASGAVALLRAAGPRLLALEFLIDVAVDPDPLLNPRLGLHVGPDLDPGVRASAMLERLLPEGAQSWLPTLRELRLQLQAGTGEAVTGTDNPPAPDAFISAARRREQGEDIAAAGHQGELPVDTTPQQGLLPTPPGGVAGTSAAAGSRGGAVAAEPVPGLPPSAAVAAAAGSTPVPAHHPATALGAVVSALSRLSSLTCLELGGPLLSRLLTQLEYDSAALQPLRGLPHLTRLALPFDLAIPAPPDTAAADAAAAAAVAVTPRPGSTPSASALASKRWHILYGAAVHSLLAPLTATRPPSASSPTASAAPSPKALPPPPLACRLVDLDLGHDIALTLPYLPYAATALTRLCVGELSCEAVAAGQWDLVPEPPPPLPLELLTRLPAWTWAPVPVSAAATSAPAAGQPAAGGKPRCALPLAAMRLPPRLRVLRVRFLPDVAVLAALAALPDFTTLDCTAIRHPYGEICLDLAAVGLRGPPDLSAAVAAAASVPAAGGAAADGGVIARWVAEMVSSAAGLLLRVLRDEDWARHPLTLRPSPFSFLRPGYEALRWEGPHAGWMAALRPLGGKVHRLRLKQMALRAPDLAALQVALPGLQAVELQRCSARRFQLRAWSAGLGPGVALDAGGADGAPGGPADCEDMFGSSEPEDEDAA